MARHGAQGMPVMRRIGEGEPFVTDGGHLIIDAFFGRISQPEALSRDLLDIPGVVQHGIVKTAANVDDSWIGTDLRAIIRDYAGHDVHVLNDADAAGYGEFKYGAAHGRSGSILMTTLGTGIGTAMIVDGTLVPMEAAHLPYKKATFEDYVGERAVELYGKKKWRKHVNDVIARFRAAFIPEEVVIGGRNARLLTTPPPGTRIASMPFSASTPSRSTDSEST